MSKGVSSFTTSMKELIKDHDGLNILKEHYGFSDDEVVDAMKQGLLDLVESKSCYNFKAEEGFKL